MWKLAFCPRFSCKSVIVILVMVQLLLFIAGLIYTGAAVGTLNEIFFLGLQWETLQRFGMRMPWLIHDSYEIHRLLLSPLLHFGFSHFVICVLLQTIVGSLVESVIGSLRLVILYFLVGIGSSLFACICTDNYGVGSEVFVYGMLASLFAMLLTYWPRMGEAFCPKICAILMLVFAVVVVVMLLTMSATTYTKILAISHISYPDVFAGIGGFIVGLLSSLWMMPSVEGNKRTMREQILFLSGIIGSVIFFVVVILVFAFASPKEYWRIE